MQHELHEPTAFVTKAARVQLTITELFRCLGHWLDIVYFYELWLILISGLFIHYSVVLLFWKLKLLFVLKMPLWKHRNFGPFCYFFGIFGFSFHLFICFSLADCKIYMELSRLCMAEKTVTQQPSEPVQTSGPSS